MDTLWRDVFLAIRPDCMEGLTDTILGRVRSEDVNRIPLKVCDPSKHYTAVNLGAGSYGVGDRRACRAGSRKQRGGEERRQCGMHVLCGLTFELSRHQRCDARARMAKMYRVPPAGPAWHAVGARLVRGVRQHCAGAERGAAAEATLMKHNKCLQPPALPKLTDDGLACRR